jgi:hypothetical protein
MAMRSWFCVVTALMATWPLGLNGQRASPAAPGAARQVVHQGDAFAPSILYDTARKEFRLWYDVSPGVRGKRVDLVHRRSTDGTTWGDPTIAYSDDAWGAVVKPHGDTYRWLFYLIDQAGGDATPLQGVYAAESADGIAWPRRHGPVLVSKDGVGDIVDPFYDPLRRRWAAFVKMFAESGEFGPNPKLASVRRLTGLSIASDFLTSWTPPARVFVPDGGDEGETEFYGAACCVVRGDYLIAFLRVLRDDIGEGIGYTVLAWTRDGNRWERAREPFLNRCDRGSPDGAMAWVYGVAEHEGVTYLSYSAYDTGHKVGRRAVMIARMRSSELGVPSAGGPPRGRTPACGATFTPPGS